MQAESFSMVYVTAGDRDEALRIGRTLVEERLAACANVFDGMTSVYRWEGKIEESNEAVLIVKTRTESVEAVIARVKERHSYSCPCIVSWPLQQGSPEYCRWLFDETA